MKQENIHIKHQEKVDEKIQEFIIDGVSSFHVVADFDRTLTCGFNGEKKVNSGYACIRDGNYLSKEFTQKANALFEYYYPIEVSHSISFEEKNEKMKEWWNKGWQLLKKYDITLQILQDIAQKNKKYLRSGVDQFFEFLRRENVPILIFSAGIGNLIQEILNIKKFLSPNVHIISNYFEFNDSGKCIGYNKDPIYTFNKNESHVKDHTYHTEIEKRKNVILLGDTLGDLDMCNGIKHDTILKIGFFNEKINDRRELFAQFFDAYDIVITDDSSFEYVNQILQKIIENESKNNRS
tara:strand:- start:635 stop:1516 length:882 start_codon:yes stop_codon:yes gene_type:complete